MEHAINSWTYLIRPVGVLAAVAALSALGTTPVLAAGHLPAPGGRELSSVANTGVADTGPASTAMSRTSLVAMADKLAYQASFQRKLTSAGTVQPMYACATVVCPASTIENAAWAPIKRPLFYEGEGNNNAWWTCGPSSTRNMVYGMTHGTANYSEATYAYWEGTNSSGTYIGNIEATLNNHFSAWGWWGIHAPTSNSDLLSTIATDVHAHSPQSSIQNVSTAPFWFWYGHATHHYNLAYGYNVKKAYVAVGEEWDNVVSGSGGTGVPYGLHAVPVGTDLAAIQQSSTREMVW